MNSKVTLTKAKHYEWGKGCEAWHLLQHPALSIIQEMMPPNTSEQLHFHQKAQQFFYILEGQAHFECEGEKVVLDKGEGLHISPMEKHFISNNGPDDLHFLVISQPPSHGDRVNLDKAI